MKRLGSYGENAAGKWVRCSAFREIDYDREKPGSLREFDNFEDAFTFDAAGWHWPSQGQVQQHTERNCAQRATCAGRSSAPHSGGAR